MVVTILTFDVWARVTGLTTLDRREQKQLCAKRLVNDSYSSAAGLARSATGGRAPIGRADREIARAYAFEQSGDLHNAVLGYRRAIELEPDSFRAYNNLGTLFASLKDGDTALTFLHAALALNPGVAEIHNNVGNVHLARSDLPAAIASYRAAIRLEPNKAVYHNHLGNALRLAGDFPGAERAFEKALFCDPSYAEASVNLGFTLAEQGKFATIEEHYRRALRVKPDLAVAHVNLSQHLLRRGELTEGWREAEWRWQWKQFPSPGRNFSQPQWRGEPLGHTTILLHAEQGLGDTLQMLRYVPLVGRRCARIVLEVPPEMLSLAKPLEAVTHLVGRGDALPSFHWHCPLMSLPLAFSTTLDTIPTQTPYLAAPCPQRPSWLRAARAGRMQVGLVWAGNPKNTVDHRRSLPLAQLAPLFAVERLDIYSLQRGGTPGEIASSGLTFAGALPESVDFAETASALTHLDLVITVDTAVAHLAGALGCPVWILLPHVADWRWLLDRDDSPWYPTAKLFRQTAPQAWTPLVEKVVGCLAEMADEPN